MRFTPENVSIPCRVYEVEARRQINHVRLVDTHAGLVEVVVQPPRIKPGTNEIETKELRFRSIFPIQGEEPLPGLIHCYGAIGA